MKNYKLYLYTTISLVLFSVLVSVISIPYLLKINGSDFLANTISLCKVQVEQLALLSHEKNDITNAETKVQKIAKLQEVIKKTETDVTFLSVLDWSGKILCHPDITQVGEIISTNTTNAKPIEDAELGEQLYDKIYSEDFTKSEKENEVIYLQSVKGTDFIIAAQLKVPDFKLLENTWRTQYYLFALIVSLLLIVVLLGGIRIISLYYQNIIEEKNNKFEDGVLNLSKLNASLESYQNKLTELNQKEDIPIKSEDITALTDDIEKRRILTYVRNELVPITMTDIAYIYVENTITYVIRKNGKRSISNDSLDQIYSNLDNTSFFRVNRQIIVAITAIEKILKFGNSQLKIQVNPPSEIDIIIGKNKAAAFKQWLDM